MATPRKKDVIVEDGTVYVLRSGTSVYVKTADICAMTGKSNQWIGQLISQGILSKRSTSQGMLFDVAATIRAYCDMLEARTSKEEKTEEELERDITKDTADAMLKVAKATIAKLEAEELQGKMHRSEDVVSFTEDLIYTIRGALMALPGRLAINVSQVNSAPEASEIIRSEVYKVMEELSRYNYDPKKYEERVRERRNWEVKKDSYVEDDGS